MGAKVSKKSTSSAITLQNDAESSHKSVPVVEPSQLESNCVYTVFVRRLADTEDTSIEVSPNMTVSKLKDLIADSLSVAPDIQKLVLGEDTIMSDEQRYLDSYGVEPNANILVVKVDLPFAIGKEIEGKDANGRWMHGVITEENPDGTLKMCLKEDKRIWPKVHKANTRPIPEFEIDESLEGMDENGKWFPIIVKGRNDDGTYACDVLRADGSIQRRWDKSLRRNMRYIQDFNEYPDAHYYGFDCNGKAWSVKITRKNDNGTYFCEVQDGHHTKWAEALRCNLW